MRAACGVGTSSKLKPVGGAEYELVKIVGPLKKGGVAQCGVNEVRLEAE